jgi:radical SAM superfamily enzyme YgiQ (UPF0313 family)
MVFRGQLDGRLTLASLKDNALSLAAGNDWIAAWDLGGRLYSLWKHGHTYRRGLNGRVLHKWTDEADRTSARYASPYDARSRTHLDDGEADTVVDEAASRLRAWIDAVERRPSEWRDRSGASPGATALALFRRCAAFDSPAARADAARFAAVFSPVGILPPDQYLSIVLQATEGCSFGTCTFCDLYHERYRVKPAPEFADHAAAVRDYLGESALLRGRSVFLGAANALAVPMPRLLEFLSTIAAVFGPRPVHAFLDGFAGLHKSSADYALLRERGLRKVYVGLESGHDPLLAFVRKPATSAQAVATVRALKLAGVSVGVIVMAGLGGRRFSDGHVADTIAVLNDMALDDGDLLYFSDLVEVPATSYPQLAAEADVRPLSLDARLAQIAAIRAGLRFPAAPPRVARYDVREFVY